MVQLPFNAQGINPEFGGFSTDPVWAAGWFKVVIASDRVVELNDNKGNMLAMEIKQIEGPTAGQSGTIMCSIWHTDPTARDRAAQQMAALCFCLGIGGFNDTTELQNRPFWVENKTGRTRKGQDGKEYPQNNFTGVKRIDGVEPGKVPSAGGAPQQQMMQPPAPPPAPPAPPGPGGWAPPAAPNAAPAAPSYPQPPAMATAPGAPPASPSGWAPPGAPQQQQPQPPAAPGGWTPQGVPPAAPGWGPPR